MKVRYAAAVAALAFGALAVLPAHGALKINEVLFNEVGSDTGGEWIEIFNTGPDTIDLTNYKIGDEETSGGTSLTEALFQFPSGATIAPGAVQIVSANASVFNTNYGFFPTYETSSSTGGTVPGMTNYLPWDVDGGIMNMSNSNDQAVLVDGTDAIIDAVSWGNTFAFDPALGSTSDGQSYERINAYVDTDTAADWAKVADTSVPAAQRSTPGVANVPEPASLGLGLAGILLVARRRTRR